ncbi:MAG: hypothetical protein U0R80_19960 [Nocardioidaceae bacterium]
MTTHLPAPMQIRELIGDLLDREITLGPTSPFAPSQFNPATIAVYTDDSLIIKALVMIDLPLSAAIGAALGLMPASAALAVIEEGKVNDAIRENLAEVLNIALSLFNVDHSPHLKLYQVHAAGDAMPPNIQSHALTLGRREDLKIDVQGYPSGRFSIVLV